MDGFALSALSDPGPMGDGALGVDPMFIGIESLVADPVLVVAFALTVDGVVGSVAPALPGGALSFAGLALFFITGPVGTLVGVAATVFAIEFYRGETSRTSARSAGVTAVGLVVSLGVQLVLTLTVLVGFATAVLRYRPTPRPYSWAK